MIFKLLTYQSEKHKGKQFQFYIQSKGNNAGRPLLAPKPNCWIVETDIPFAYEICTVLWVSNVYEIHIIGSVIPFLRTYDYLKVTLPYLSFLHSRKIQVLKKFEAISNLDKLIDTTQSKLKTIHSLKISVAAELLREMHS